MTRDFEYMSYDDADRIAILENRAAELERRLLAVLPQEGRQGWGNVATPGDAGTGQGEPIGDAAGRRPAPSGTPMRRTPTAVTPRPTARWAVTLDGGQGDGGAGASGPAGRTEALINHGRSPARPARTRRILAHWRLIAVAAVALLAGVIAALVAVGGGGASWPAQRDHGPGGDQAGLREPGRRGRAERSQLRLRQGHPAGALGLLAADQRRQSRLRRPDDRTQGPRADPGGTGR